MTKKYEKFLHIPCVKDIEELTGRYEWTPKEKAIMKAVLQTIKSYSSKNTNYIVEMTLEELKIWVKISEKMRKESK